MQNTRLNSLIAVNVGRLGQWLQNPWRRFSLLLISLLFGNFLATVVATSTGQNADLDIVVAALLLVLTETISRLAYRVRRPEDQPAGTRPLAIAVQQAFFIDMLNALKIGLTFGLFVEAFKLGS